MKLCVQKVRMLYGTSSLCNSSIQMQKLPRSLLWLYCFAWGVVVLQLLSCGKNDQSETQKGNHDGIYSEKGGLFSKFSKDMPIYQYYQKIPEVTGVTNDRLSLIFNLQFELGYDLGDVKTLEKLSKYAVKIAGEVRSSTAMKTKAFLGGLNHRAEIEGNILRLVNKIIAPDPNDKARVKDVIITVLSLYDYR